MQRKGNLSRRGGAFEPILALETPTVVVGRHLRLVPRPEDENSSVARREPRDGKLGPVAAPQEPEDGLCFEEVYRRFSAYVAGTAIKVLGRDDEVDDIVQEVFLACARREQPLATAVDARRWLAAVTVRIACGRLKRRRRWRWVIPLEDRHFFVRSPELGPEDRATLRQLYRALDKVPPPQRTAWVLRKLQGERLDDVASACECSLATAKRWIAQVNREVGGSA